MTKLSRRTVALITSLVLAGAALPAAAAPPGGEGPGAGQIFESLEQAAEYGAVDPQLVKQLRAGKKVVIIAQLDPVKVIDAYGIGDETGVARASELVAQMRATVLKEVPVKPVDIFQLVPQFVTELSDAELALRLINSELVASLIPDRANNLHLDESLTVIGQRPLAIGGTLNGTGTSVVVLDTGADFTDVDLGMCTAPGVPAGCRVPVAFDAAPDDASMDDHGHGTNVSAVVAGVAPGAQVIPIDVYSGAYIRDRHAIAALNWVLANRYRYNIVAVNMSFGFDNYFTTACGGTAFLNAYTYPFQMMRQAGTLPVASAGNHASQSGTFQAGVAAPACTAGAIGVGASYTHDESTDQMWVGCTDKAPVITDQLACFSAGGPMVDVIAPGTDINAAGITMNGTSQASPHVAAAVALLAQAAPLSTALQRETQLKTSGTQLFDRRTSLLHPRLDLPAAVRAAAPVPNDDLANRTVLSGQSGRITQTTWTATVQLGEPLHGGDVGGASVWYEWTPAFAINAVFSTAGSDFDTLLGVYQLDVRGVPVFLAGNDDEAMGVTTSEVSLNVTAGQKLMIAVDGKFNQAGLFPATGRAMLTWNLPNDNIADAVAFPGTINTIGVARPGSNLRSTHQIGEPAHCGDVYANASVWYRWTPSIDQPVRVRLAGAQPMCLTIYSVPQSMMVPAFSQLTLEVALADDQGTPIDHEFTGLRTQTYWLAVDGVSNEVACHPNGMCDYETSAGPFSLQFN